MKRVTLLLSIAMTALCGCAQHYVIKMQNGNQITTASKPKLQHGQYVYKDGAGRVQYISQGRVREIAPASMAGDGSPNFKPQKSN